MLQRFIAYSYAKGLFLRSLMLAAVVELSVCTAGLATGPTVDWIRQLWAFDGDSDSVSGLSLDGLGGLYLSFSLLGPSPPYGAPYLDKYDLDGNQIWRRQITSGGVSADGLGNVFTGNISNLDVDGNVIWSLPPQPGAISADGAGNVYTVRPLGRPLPSDDGLLRKFDAAGNLIWSRQFGSSDHEQELIVSADAAGNVFTYGQRVLADAPRYTPSATLTKFDADGNEYWTRTLESARYVLIGGVAADGLGNVYNTGRSNAPILKPRVHLGYDAFLAKYDAEGNRLWLQEFGTAEFADSARGVAFDGQGNVFVTGNMGDPFLAKFDGDGNQAWLHQFGTPADDLASFVAADALGNVYVAGQTRGDFGSPNAGGGGYDVFLAKFNVNVPEPPAGRLLLIAVGLGGVLWRASHRVAYRST
jgi:hypothetical protein